MVLGLTGEEKIGITGWMSAALLGESWPTSLIPPVITNKQERREQLHGGGAIPAWTDATLEP